MEKYFRLLSMLTLFILFKVNGVAMENSYCTVSRELDTQCGGYCYKIVKPLLEHASRVFLKEQEFAGLEAKLHEQEIIIKTLNETIESTKSKDIQLAEKLDSYVNQINTSFTEKYNKLLLLAESPFKLEHGDRMLEYINKGFGDLQYSINELLRNLQTNMFQHNMQISLLASNSRAFHRKMNVLKLKLAEYKEMCMASSCVGKLTDIYTIKVPGIAPFSVLCESNLGGVGWTVIQRRIDDSEDFNRTWEEYKNGFGDLKHGQFFLGLEKIHRMTVSQPHELYIYLENFDNETRYAQYTDFQIGDETESYKIEILGNYSGNAGNSLDYHLNMKFSTIDRDNDVDEFDNCAIIYASGWWFKNCSQCNLNGVYTSDDNGKGSKRIHWNDWNMKPLKFTQIMIRPLYF